MKRIKIADIRTQAIDPDWPVRVYRDKVEDIARHLSEGATFAPIRLSARLQIRDGNHRLLGHIIAGRTEIEAIIVD
jgi:ParB-like chromosome segregation protein Spo0J